MKNTKRNYTEKLGFTLAEVLITLGIIGAIAAMTLPSLINKINGAENRTALLKSYSILTQALQRLEAEQGYPAKRENYGNRQFTTNYKKYLKITKDCGYESCFGRTSEGDETYISKVYKNFNQTKYAPAYFFDDGQYILNDGIILMIEDDKGSNTGTGNFFLTVDVNGVNKKPNAWGKDLFTFQIMNDSGKLIPMGAEGTYYTDLSKYCSKTSIERLNGIACTYKAMTKKDYFNKL